MKNKLIAVIAILCVLAGVSLRPSHKTDSYFYNRTVKLLGNGHQCSGEQVAAPSGVDYILTAGHCRALVDESGQVTVIREDGVSLMRKMIIEDPTSDLLLFEGLPGVSGLEVANRVRPHDHVRTFTHGKGFNTYRTDGVIIQDKQVRIALRAIEGDQDEAACSSMPKLKVEEVPGFFGPPQKVCIMDVEETFTTAFIAPGSSGGMVINDEGKLVGVVSCGDGQYGGLVELSDIRSFLKAY